MKVPYSWIQEYLDIDLSPVQVEKLLTMAGLEVEGVEGVGQDFSDVVVAKVIQVDPHPDADKLCVATVFDGEQRYQVVCGDPKCRVDMKTALAKVGARLKSAEGDVFKIRKTKLRGVESFGMLCSGKELGISEDDAGIIEFEGHICEGADVSEMYADTVFDIALTPNLAHCASVIGVVRELSAVTGVSYCLPHITLNDEATSTSGQSIHVTIQDREKCPRYACRVVSNVKIGSSPDWMQKRLTASGIRPVNNVVDITNYVLLELGHPLHAFDYDTLNGHRIDVRSAHKGEEMITLDNKKRMLREEDLLICDAEKPIAIAGVMGGISTEVSDNTQNLLIESAYFSPTGVRKTSKHLGLHTDASRRFEKGADPNQALISLDRVCMLLQQLANGKVSVDVIDDKTETFQEKQIPCRLTRTNALLGTHLGVDEVETIFQRLEFRYDWDGKDFFTVTVPTYRTDLSLEIDLIEEVARIYGYENIPKKVARFQSSSLEDTPIFLFEREVKERLISEGLQELITCDLIGPSQTELMTGSFMSENAIVTVLNPTSVEQSLLRPSLLPGLMQVVKINYARQNHSVSGFEVGRIHFREGNRYKEQSMAGVILTGKSSPHHWETKDLEFDFYDLKGIIENVFSGLQIPNVTFKKQEMELLHPGRQASIFVGDLDVGTFGEIHPTLLRRLDIPQRIYFAECNLHDLFQFRKERITMQTLPKFPGSDRDWTLTLDTSVAVQEVLNSARNFATPLLEDVYVLDLFRNDKLGKNNQNITLRFVYRDLEKTMAQEAVEAEHARILSKVSEQYGIITPM